MKRALILASLLLGACGGAAASGGGAARVADAERTRKGLEGRDAQTLAPQRFAEADLELRLAKEANASGDATGAELHADRAVAAFADAVALARLARATEDEAQASDALAKATELAQRYAAQRKATDREADDLEKQLRIVREAQLPASSGATEPDREKARIVAAKALTTQARLLCSAARLVSPQAPGLAEAESGAATLEKQLEAGTAPASSKDKNKPNAIDAAGRARAACLTSLTKARRAAPADADTVDTLLSELSRADAAKHELSPARDERGVVVTLRSAFKGTALTPEAESTLKDLGRVAAAHPQFGVQIVVHDATAPSAADMQADAKRGESVSKALTDGGAASAKLKVELAAARAPVVDPQDTKHRDRNARIEIVFVAPTQ
jgi:outer membrane protein OmpA-like peptidoglycan-associated protein